MNTVVQSELQFDLLDNGSMVYDSTGGDWKASIDYYCSDSGCTPRYYFYSSAIYSDNTTPDNSTLWLSSGDKVKVKFYTTQELTNIVTDSSKYETWYKTGPLQNPMWDESRAPFYVTLKSGKKKNFSDIWEYSNWVLQGHQIPKSDADGRGERCSYWKESTVDKSEIDFNGTYRDMCLAADGDVHNSKFLPFFNLRNNVPTFFANIDLLNLIKNAYNFETYQDKLAILNFAFPRETF